MLGQAQSGNFAIGGGGIIWECGSVSNLPKSEDGKIFPFFLKQSTHYKGVLQLLENFWINLIV